MLAKAQESFEELQISDIVAWTVLREEALRCFKEMQEDGILPDAATFVKYICTPNVVM